MAKIINGNPAAYPNSSTSEIEAANVLINNLDVSRIRHEIKTLDKIPNVDGHIEVLTETLVPIGKLEVQVKALDKKNKNNPKFQCSKEFLAYCENSISPVLLIVVDIDNKLAYWSHISHSLLKELAKKIKKESVNLDLDKSNFIKGNPIDYIEKWIKIIREYQEKIFEYDNIIARKIQLEDKLNELNHISNDAIGKRNPIYSEIHIFLDYYNSLLDNDFKTIKSILYPAYWKIGLGYSEYELSHTKFMLYPIPYDINDVLIKKFDTDYIFTMRGALSVRGYNIENPIKSRPEKFAYELIEGDLENVFKYQSLLVKNTFLAKEYVFAFIDRFNAILGLKANESQYSIKDIEYGLYRFLPFFIGENIFIHEKLKGQAFSFDIDNFHYSSHSEVSVNIIQQAQKKLKKNPLIEIPKIFLLSKEFNIDVLTTLLGHLTQQKIETIKREYDIKQVIKNRIYFNWQAWSDESIMKNLRLFHENFPIIYDAVISTYFPNLFNDLKFYKNYNLIIVVLDFTRKSEMFGIAIDYYYLQSSENVEPKITFYNSNDSVIPISRNTARTVYENGLSFSGNIYKLKYQTHSTLKSIFDKTPILTAVKKLLEERFKEYFKKKIN